MMGSRVLVSGEGYRRDNSRCGAFWLGAPLAGTGQGAATRSRDQSGTTEVPNPTQPRGAWRLPKFLLDLESICRNIAIINGPALRVASPGAYPSATS